MKVERIGLGGAQDLLVVLQPGDELHASMIQAAAEHRIEGGFLTAIGAVDEVELGYFCVPERVYSRRVVRDDLEVVSIHGNLSLRDGKPFLHAHGLFTGRDFAAIGGHIFRARVSITLEVFVTQTARMTRQPFEEFGLTRLL
jgi:predicted DNA-binding protein with PD1-like motif